MTSWLRVPVVRSTPLRLTGILLSVFLLSSIASFTIAYLAMRENFDATLEDEISQTIEIYRAVETQEELLERLTEDAQATRPDFRVLQYLPDKGTRIANVEGFPPISGLTVIPEKAIEHEDREIADSYLAKSARIGRGQLIVAQTREQVVEMGEIFLTVLLIGLLPTITIASVAGLLIARSARRRIDNIQAVLLDLTGGQLTARVPDVESDQEDLSRISRAVNQLAASQEALISSMRQVTADIAHDLKTPIQRVAVILDQVMRKTKLSDGPDALLRQALDETDRIVGTFQALLQLAQIEGGAVRDRFMQTDLQAAAVDVVDLLRAEAEDEGYHIDLTMQRNGPFTVTGDRHLLTQVVANLVGNGLRHVPAGGSIRVDLSRKGQQVVLSVSDNGPGIPPKERENVLRRLYRLEHSRTTEGGGLGLSLVAAICDLHRASLTLEDNGPGLLVRVVFPKES